MSQSFLAESNMYLHRGIIDQAVEAIGKTMELAENYEFKAHFLRANPILGYAYALAGRAEEAIPLIKNGIERGVASGLMEQQSLRVTYLGEAYLINIRLNDAEENAAHALELARKHTERPYEAWALRLLGEIHSHPDALDAEKAEDHYRQALALAEELGMRPLQAHCRKGLGALYTRTGREEKGREELTAACDMYREMGMDFFLNQAEEVLAEVG